MYAITEKLRAALKEPLGTIIPDASLHEFLKKGGRRVCAVGDECAYRMLLSGVSPQIVIFDRMTRRAAVQGEVGRKISSYCASPVKVSNPAGSITEALESAIRQAFGNGSGCIMVDGEEDLATLVAMRESDDSWAIVYGQPDAGAVVVMGGEAAKAKANAMLAGFEKK